MKHRRFFRGMFMVATWYDLLLGFAFFLFYAQIYSLFKIEPPDNPSYVHLAAAFVFVQGIAYYFVYLNLERNIDIVKIGVIYKAVYTGVAFYHWAAGTLPHPMFALFGFLDLVFLLLFLLYLREVIPPQLQVGDREGGVDPGVDQEGPEATEEGGGDESQPLDQRDQE